MSTETEPPIRPIIIIKKRKIQKGDEHHGGAWKVAYADFVTAMMAFFLLMWLLNATTEEQRKGLADYFNPTIPISRISGGGSDGLNGSSIFTEQTYAKMGTGASSNKTVSSPTTNPAVDPEQIAKNLENLKASLEETEGHLSEHIAIKLSPEGIILELIDSEDMPLFATGLSKPTPLLTTLLDIVAGSLDSFENDIKIVGHTDSLQYRDHARYDNWNLSADRANTARRLMTYRGIPEDRIREVSGKASTEPLVIEDPAAAQNRRISIVILTQ